MSVAHCELSSDIPAGAFAIGVSGGADSVALLHLALARADLRLHVVHLDHQTRGADSAADATFVAELAQAHHLPCTVARLDQIDLPHTRQTANPSARYRAARHQLFRQTIAQHALQGVLLAHHADDQAETIFQRLLRGGGYAGMIGMSARARVREVEIYRPLLQVRRERLREYLAVRSIAWREDASNASAKYLRNRLRRILNQDEALTEALLHFGAACRALREVIHSETPHLPAIFRSEQLAGMSDLHAEAAARRWLIERGIKPQLIDGAAVGRLIDMTRDLATPAAQTFPGGTRVRRRRGQLFLET